MKKPIFALVLLACTASFAQNFSGGLSNAGEFDPPKNIDPDFITRLVFSVRWENRTINL